MSRTGDDKGGNNAWTAQSEFPLRQGPRVMPQTPFGAQSAAPVLVNKSRFTTSAASSPSTPLPPVKQATSPSLASALKSTISASPQRQQYVSIPPTPSMSSSLGQPPMSLPGQPSVSESPYPLARPAQLATATNTNLPPLSSQSQKQGRFAQYAHQVGSQANTLSAWEKSRNDTQQRYQLQSGFQSVYDQGSSSSSSSATIPFARSYVVPFSQSQVVRSDDLDFFRKHAVSILDFFKDRTKSDEVRENFFQKIANSEGISGNIKGSNIYPFMQEIETIKVLVDAVRDCPVKKGPVPDGVVSAGQIVKNVISYHEYLGRFKEILRVVDSNYQEVVSEKIKVIFQGITPRKGQSLSEEDSKYNLSIAGGHRDIVKNEGFVKHIWNNVTNKAQFQDKRDGKKSDKRDFIVMLAGPIHGDGIDKPATSYKNIIFVIDKGVRSGQGHDFEILNIPYSQVVTARGKNEVSREDPLIEIAKESWGEQYVVLQPTRGQLSNIEKYSNNIVRDEQKDAISGKTERILTYKNRTTQSVNNYIGVHSDWIDGILNVTLNQPIVTQTNNPNAVVVHQDTSHTTAGIAGTRDYLFRSIKYARHCGYEYQGVNGVYHLRPASLRISHGIKANIDDKISILNESQLRALESFGIYDSSMEVRMNASLSLQPTQTKDTYQNNLSMDAGTTFLDPPNGILEHSYDAQDVFTKACDLSQSPYTKGYDTHDAVSVIEFLRQYYQYATNPNVSYKCLTSDGEWYEVAIKDGGLLKDLNNESIFTMNDLAFNNIKLQDWVQKHPKNTLNILRLVNTISSGENGDLVRQGIGHFKDILRYEDLERGVKQKLEELKLPSEKSDVAKDIERIQGKVEKFGKNYLSLAYAPKKEAAQKKLNNNSVKDVFYDINDDAVIDEVGKQIESEMKAELVKLAIKGSFCGKTPATTTQRAVAKPIKNGKSSDQLLIK